MQRDYRDQFEHSHYFEVFERNPSFMHKKMFGCLALYLNGRLIALISEDGEQNYYKDKKFDYPIWNGLLLPTEREHQASLISDFPSLGAHPVLGKWLYLPWTEEDHEEIVTEIVRLIMRGDPRFGVLPKPKKVQKNKKSKVKKVISTKNAKRSKLKRKA